MSQAFDPYLNWLGIRDPGRPPNYYRLLGVEPFEDDPAVLTHAADRQMAHVRKFQTGKHSAESQRLLNELATAKICLLNAEKKVQYDARLRAELGTGQATAAISAQPMRATLDAEPLAGDSSPWLSCAIATLVAMVLTLGGLIIMATMRGDPKDEETGATASPQTTEPEEPSQFKPETPTPETPSPENAEPDTTDPESSLPEVPEPQPEPVEPDVVEPAADQRLAIPPKVAQAAMLKQIRQLFKQQYAAATVPAGKHALAVMLLQKGVETQDDPVARYVLFGEARDLAVEVGDAEMLLKTVKLIGEEYTVDWLVAAATVLQKSGKLLRPPDRNKAMGNAALMLASEAVARDEYDLAAVLAEAARDMGRSTRTAANPYPQLVRQAVAMMRNVTAWRQRHEEFIEAQAVLARQADDPAANLTAGMYYCFVKDDFARGLPMIVCGDDAILKGLAAAELTRPSETAEMVTLADRWWAASEDVEESTRQNFQSRAVHWYRRALPGLSGLTGDVVRGRIEEFSGTSSDGNN